MRWWRRYSGSRLFETRNRQGRWEVTLYNLLPRVLRWFWWRQHISTINTNRDLSFTTIQKQTCRRKQLMDQADDNSLTALLTKRDQVRFREVVNTCTERRAEKRIQRTAWILSHVLRTTLCEHVNGLCPAGWLNEQSITKHWFQSLRTCPYSWATGRNSIQLNLKSTLTCSFFFKHLTYSTANLVPTIRCTLASINSVLWRRLLYDLFFCFSSCKAQKKFAAFFISG